MCKSKSFRLKTGCAFSSRMMMISPGSIPGSWSPSLVNVIFWPSFIPLSMWTSRILRSLTVFLPWQVLQRSFSKTEKKFDEIGISKMVSKAFFYSLKLRGPKGTGEVRMDPCLLIKRGSPEGLVFYSERRTIYSLCGHTCFRIRWAPRPCVRLFKAQKLHNSYRFLLQQKISTRNSQELCTHIVSKLPSDKKSKWLQIPDILSPFPPQSLHCVWICCTIPGAIWLILIYIPLPWHVLQVTTESCKQQTINFTYHILYFKLSFFIVAYKMDLYEKWPKT